MLGKEFIVVTKDSMFETKVRNASAGLSESVTIVAYSSTDDSLAACELKAPAAVIFDVTLFPPEQSLLFMQKLRKLKTCSFVPLVAACQKITPSFVHLSSEYVFFRIIEKGADDRNIRTTLAALVAELERPSGLRMGFLKLAQAQAKGQAGEADRILEDLYSMFRDDIDVLVEYGNMCLRKGKLERAQKVMERLSGQANGAHSQNLRVCNFMARVWLKQGNIGGALNVLDRANVLSPSNLERLTLMGDAFRFKGDFKNAEEKYLEVLKLDSENASGRRGVALTALSQGESDRALEFFKGVCSEEEMGGFFNNTAVMAVRRKQFSKAKKLYEAAEGALGSNTLKAKVAYNTGLLLRKWNRPAEAVASFKKAVQLDASFQKAETQLEKMGVNVFHETDSALEQSDPSKRGNTAAALSIIENAGPTQIALQVSANESEPEASAWDGDQDPLIMDFADDTLLGQGGAEASPPVVQRSGKSGSGVRTVDDAVQDIKPFSVQQLLANTKPKPKPKQMAKTSPTGQTGSNAQPRKPAEIARANKTNKAEGTKPASRESAGRTAMKKGSSASVAPAFIYDDDDEAV